jgi:hypothetical protein
MKCSSCYFEDDLSLYVYYCASKIICENCGVTRKDRESSETSREREIDLSKRGFYFSSLEALQKSTHEQLKFNFRFNKNKQPKFHLTY